MRVEGKCIGDCSKCQLLANGEVDMIPCILDQIFIRTRKIEKENAFIRRSLDSMTVSYTHLTLPTNREEYISVVAASLKK